MNDVVLSPRAKLDLNEIWDYTLLEWGAGQAERYVRELWSTLLTAASDPARAVAIGEVRKGYRKSRYGSHVIFFKVTGNGIDLVRILHQRMDFDRHL